MFTRSKSRRLKAAFRQSVKAVIRRAYQCRQCQHPTVTLNANVCRTCMIYTINQCAKCLCPINHTNRTWMVQCYHDGVGYANMDYVRACEKDGIRGPLSSRDRNGYEGPLPQRPPFAFYALAKWQNPWRAEARKRPGRDGDPTFWKSTGCCIDGYWEKMRRLPFCVDCAWDMPREYEGAPIKLWNRWQTQFNWGQYDPITSKDQFHRF